MTRSILLEAADRWRPIKAAASVVALTGLVLGIPLALIEIGGMPFSHTGLAQLTRTVARRTLAIRRLLPTGSPGPHWYWPGRSGFG